MKYAYFLLLFILFALKPTDSQANNFNFRQMTYGEDILFLNARHLGMGGSGLAGGTPDLALFANPALLGKSKNGIAFSFGTGLNKRVEDRSFPYYDTFVGFNDYGSYSFNAYWYNSFYGMLRYSFPLKAVGQICLAAGYQPFKEFRYDYEEEVRDPVDKSDKLLGYNSIHQKGRLDEIPIAVSVKPLPGFTVGFKAGLLTGSIDSTMIIDPKDAALANIAQTDRRRRTLRKKPLLFSVGLHYQFNNRLFLGAVVRTPYTVEFTNRFTSIKADTMVNQLNRKLEYPLTIGAGLEYRFQNILAARINFDFKYEFWSRFKDSRSPGLNFNDTYTFNAGIEHLFFDKIPLRAGFLYRTLPQSRDFTRSVLSVGSGFRMGALKIDFAGGFSSFLYYQQDLFPDSIYNLSPRSDSDKVQITSYFIRLNLSYFLSEELF